MRFHRLLALEFALFLLLVSPAASTLPEPTFNVIALSGQQAPGAPSGSVFGNEFSEPTLNDAGDVLFLGRMEVGTGDVTETNDSGLWGSDAAGELTLLAREGEPPPGGEPGTRFHLVRNPVLNEAGDVGFDAILRQADDPTQIVEAGFWGTHGANGVHPLARRGIPAPGIPDAVLDGANGGHLNDVGGMAFQGQLRLEGGVDEFNDWGLWVLDSAGEVVFLGREGFPVPGAPPGALLLDVGSVDLNNSAEVVLQLVLEPGVGGIDDADVFGVVAPDGHGGHSLVARGGTAAPGASEGTLFHSVWAPELNDSGEFAFIGQLRIGTGDVTSENDMGIWRSDGNGAPELVVREASWVSWGIVTRVATPIILNEDGELFFAARISSMTGEEIAGFWALDRDSDLRLAAPTSALLPGDPTIRFTASELSVNDRGDVFMEAGTDSSQEPPPVTIGKQMTTLLISTRDGELVTVLREGDEIEIEPGDVRTVSQLRINAESVAPNALTNYRDAGFVARFDDSTEAVIVASFRESVAIDVKPGSDLNRIDPTRPGVIPVAVLGSDRFDVSTIDPTSLAFGRGRASPAIPLTSPWLLRLSRRDVNGDQIDDLVATFPVTRSGIVLGTTEACLVGGTLDGDVFEGCDAVSTTAGCGLGFELVLLLAPLLWLRTRC